MFSCRLGRRGRSTAACRAWSCCKLVVRARDLLLEQACYRPSDEKRFTSALRNLRSPMCRWINHSQLGRPRNATQLTNNFFSICSICTTLMFQSKQKFLQFDRNGDSRWTGALLLSVHDCPLEHGSSYRRLQCFSSFRANIGAWISLRFCSKPDGRSPNWFKNWSLASKSCSTTCNLKTFIAGSYRQQPHFENKAQ